MQRRSRKRTIRGIPKSGKAGGRSGAPMRQVFVSCSWQDSSIAREIKDALNEAGFRVWLLEDEALPGTDLLEEVGRALEQSDALVVVLSPHSVGSPWVQNEINIALTTPRFAGRLVPVVVRGTPLGQIPWILSTMRMVQWDPSDAKRAVREIAHALTQSAGASAA